MPYILFVLTTTCRHADIQGAQESARNPRRYTALLTVYIYIYYI